MNCNMMQCNGFYWLVNASFQVSGIFRAGGIFHEMATQACFVGGGKGGDGGGGQGCVGGGKGGGGGGGGGSKGDGGGSGGGWW